MAMKNSYSLATESSINRYRSTELCNLLCGKKPFGSRHWEYPWSIEHSGVLDKSNLRILDVAPDFTFPYASFLEENHTVTFIDLEKKKWSQTVTWGAEKSELATMSDYRIMDVQNMSFPDETFHVIFCISVLEHIVCPTQDPDHPKLDRLFDPFGARPAIGEMKRCLKPGGKLIITVDLYGGAKWKPFFSQWDIFSDLANARFFFDEQATFDRNGAFSYDETFISEFHGPYITLGFKLEK
jgi:SAM-dependent methyltransferase